MNAENEIPTLNPREHKLLEIMLERPLSNDEAYFALQEAIKLAAFSVWMESLERNSIQ